MFIAPRFFDVSKALCTSKAQPCKAVLRRFELCKKPIWEGWTRKNHTDRGRKALKLSVVSDDSGMVVGACCHPGKTNVTGP